MKIEKKSDGWWIVETPPGILEMGPYITKAEAEEDVRGVHRTLKSLEPGKSRKK